jgi:hypothetical protein
MSARTAWLSRLIGLFALVTGFSMLVRGADFADTMNLMIADRPLLFLIGVIALSAGLAIVLAHNIWSGSVAAVIVTVVGWLSIVRGVFILSLPGDTARRVLHGLNLGAVAHIYTVIFLICGIYLTYAGFRARTST